MTKCGFILLILLALLISRSEGKNQNQEKTLRVSSFINHPFLHLKGKYSENSTNDDFEGFIKDLLDTLGHDYKIIIPKDWRYGAQDENGTWTGMIGDVLDGTVDMIAADLTVSSQRHEVLDFSVPFITSRLTILTKLPLDDGSQWPVIVSPFDISVWILLVAAFLLSAFVFFLVKRISPYERIWSVDKARNASDITLNESFWILIACFFHGTKAPAKALSSRLLVSGWWLFVIAVVAAYAANLHSIWSLLEGSCIQKSKYEKIEDMINNREFKFLVYGYGSTYQLLKSSTDSLHRQIYNRISENPEENLINYPAEYIERMANGDLNNAGIVMEGSNADFIKAHHCGFYTVGQLDERIYALAFPKGSPLKATFSKAILNLEETGSLQELKSRWWPQSDLARCLYKAAGGCPGLGPLEIGHFEGPILFLAIVLVLALILSLLELICNAYVKKEEGLTPIKIFVRDLKEGCCECGPLCQPARPATIEDTEYN